jgi:hypothetical protein
MPANDSQWVQRRSTYVTLTGLFVSLLGLFSWYERKRGKEAPFTPLDLAMLGLASYRLGRLAAYDQVFETLRSPFTQTVPDSYGAGNTVEAKGEGPQRAIGELISCPICAGTWISAFLVYGLQLLPRPTRTLLKVMSAMGLAEFLNAATEALQWNGEVARKQVGSQD